MMNPVDTIHVSHVLYPNVLSVLPYMQAVSNTSMFWTSYAVLVNIYYWITEYLYYDSGLLNPRHVHKHYWITKYSMDLLDKL